MREIDFLPQWYKQDIRRRVSIRRQYIVLAGVLVLMVLWTLFTSYSVFSAKARLRRLTAEKQTVQGPVKNFAGLQTQMLELTKKADVLDEVDSKIDVAAVLGELSFLVDKRIVLSKVEFEAEKFVSPAGNSGEKGMLRSAGPKPRSRLREHKVAEHRGGSGQYLGDVRFRVTISGLAADASDVAELVCRLEDSEYFCNVIPMFSRNAKVKTASKLTGAEHQVSEFELSCYLANYRQEGREG